MGPGVFYKSAAALHFLRSSKTVIKSAVSDSLGAVENQRNVKKKTDSRLSKHQLFV